MMGKTYLLEAKFLHKVGAENTKHYLIDLWSSHFLLRFLVLIVGTGPSLQSTNTWLQKI